VLFDLVTLEIRETWRDLGPAGEAVPVYESAFLHDSIYLATADGVLAGHPRDNLLDFNHWKRSTDSGLSGTVRSVVSFNDRIYAAFGSGLYSASNGNWSRENFPDTLQVQSLTASHEHLLLIADSTLWLISKSGELSQITDPFLRVPRAAKQDDTGNLWIGDQGAGLVSNIGGKFSSLLPNGPSRTEVRKMNYHNGKLFVVAGATSSAGEPILLADQVNIFEDGAWTNVSYPVPDITDITFNGPDVYVSSFGSGLLISTASGNTIHDESNSPLRNSAGDGAYITALAANADGLWVANYGGSEPLHFLKNDGSWESHSFGFLNEQNPTAISLDGRGNVWITLAPASGGGLVAFDHKQNSAYYKSTVAERGALPDKNVNCIATDLDGYVWVGTDAGVAYFPSPADDAIKPIYDNLFLLRGEKVTAIEVDAGNRKWIGTEDGVWLFDAVAQMMLQNFTTDNSPLLSNLIQDIEIDASSGEVFIATEKGIVSYRSDATRPEQEFNDAKIFPNPVSPGYSGTVGISGLTEHASVRITDISGKLVWQTRANGGTATWNVRDHHGRRASTGIYLVFATSDDGTESMVGKIAVVE
jgi:ligand-binding sensor domain-containing protein